MPYPLLRPVALLADAYGSVVPATSGCPSKKQNLLS
jgi:hypothetical protein